MVVLSDFVLKEKKKKGTPKKKSNKLFQIICAFLNKKLVCRHNCIPLKTGTTLTYRYTHPLTYIQILYFSVFWRLQHVGRWWSTKQPIPLPFTKDIYTTSNYLHKNIRFGGGGRGDGFKVWCRCGIKTSLNYLCM